MTEKKTDLMEAEGDAARLPGARLMTWLKEECANRDINLTDLADIIGISRAYLYALRYGQRPVDSLDGDTLRSMARFLHKTPVAVYVAAGILKPEDFYAMTEQTLVMEIDRSFKFVSEDQEWSEFCPPPDTLDTRGKLFIVLAYQRATSRQLLPATLTRDELANIISSA